MLLSALTALTFTAANAAEKDTSSATYMLPYCKLTTGQVVSGRGYEGYLNGECFGIVEGIRKVLGFMRVAGDFGPLPCTTIPPQVSAQQLVNVVVRYGEVHPELTHERLESFAFDALVAAWPCK